MTEEVTTMSESITFPMPESSRPGPRPTPATIAVASKPVPPEWGTSTEAQRVAWGQAMTTLHLSSSRREEIERADFSSYAYAMGWYDAVKHELTSTQEREALMAAALFFSQEYRYASWLFVTEQVSHREGYCFAWEKAMRRLPFMRAILRTRGLMKGHE